MYFKQITVPGLGCFSYVLGCPAAGAMAVVDPKRDIQDYLDISREEGMRITHVFDTHVHADHVSGAHELRAATGARICMYENAPVEFERLALAEGDTFTIGNAKLDILHTPGHTPNSISILVTDLSRGKEPWMVLTGDVLFVGDIGRPDLVGQDVLDEQVLNLYRSLYVKLGAYPDHLEVFPAHGMGSLCGKGMSFKTSSTLGFERACNRMLQFPDYREFHKIMTGTFPARPKSFTHIIETNLKGAPLLDRCPLEKAMSVDDFEARINQGAVVIDARDAAGFGGLHIKGSLNIGLEKSLANWVGMVVEPDSDILLVVSDKADYDRMVLELHRIGYDNIHGYLDGGISSWLFAGREVDKLCLATPADLAARTLDMPALLDVRTEAEWDFGHMEGAVHIPLADLMKSDPDLPRDGELVVYCGTGYRSNIAASHLQTRGFTRVTSLAGGLTAWKRAGH